MDLTIRPYADPDAAGVVALHNDRDIAFGSHPGMTEAGFRTWMHVVRDTDLDTRVIEAPDGSIVGYANVCIPSEGGERASVGGMIHPRWQGRGLGRELLAWQLDRVDQLHREIAPAAEWLMRSGAHQDDTSAARMLERFGFAAIRYWMDMERSLPDSPASPAGLDGLKVTTVEAADLPALYDAHAEAFADHFGHEPESFDDWMAGSVSSDVFRPELSRIAYDGDKIVAYILSYDEAQPDALYIGLVGTRPEWRGRGLASGLLAEVLTASASAGKTVARLGVDASNPTGAVGLYERLGFRPVGRAVSYGKRLPAVGAVSTSGSVLR